MRKILITNWSIFLGFTITLLAFMGMLVAVLFPEAVAVKLTPNRAINTLESPSQYMEFSSPVSQEARVEIARSKHEKIPATDNQPVIPPYESRVKPRSASKSKPSRAIYSVSDAGDLGAYLPGPEVPLRVVIPSIDLNAPVIPAPVEFETIGGKEYLQWFVPNEYAVGWHTTSAMLGETGNTVLNGHHNAYGEVFVSLEKVTEGDIIWVESEHSRFSYQITNKMILPEKYEQLDVRMNNAQWLLPTVDERLTLISCWPYETNTHRLIVVARPLGQEEIALSLE